MEENKSIGQRIGEMSNRLSSRFSLKSIVDINEQPLFRMPNYMYRMKYWLGAMVAAAFMFEIITGLFLLLNYYPSSPYSETIYLINYIPFGEAILFSHFYGAYFMIILIYLHLFRNYFDGAYKKPRQLLWVVGLIMFALTLGVAFTGYSLPADILGVDADGVGQGILNGFPHGNILSVIIFGNGTQLDMYTKLLAWHVILTALIGVFLVIHFLLFEQAGVLPSKRVKSTVPAIYPKETWSSFNPWWPRNFVYTLMLLTFVWGLILIVPNVLANLNGVPFLFQPAPAPSPSSPLAASIPAFPPWFFLFLYKGIDFFMPNGAPYNPAYISLLVAGIPALYLLVLPWLDRSKETLLHRRALWGGIGILLITYLVQMSVWAYVAPGVPEPFSVQVGIMLPPLIVAFLCVYAIPKLLERSMPLQFTPVTVAMLAVLVLTIVGTVASMKQEPIVYAIGVLLPIILTTGLFWASITETRDVKLTAEMDSRSKKASKSSRGNRIDQNFPLVFMAILFLLALGILGILVRFPVVGQPSTYWGIGTGIILLMFSYALRLWDYMAYPQEYDEIEMDKLMAQHGKSLVAGGSEDSASDSMLVK
ncbi:MAG: cytochrome bc complex cytochrome b subunit [Methanomassiliicoccales archaeon]